MQNMTPPGGVVVEGPPLDFVGKDFPGPEGLCAGWVDNDSRWVYRGEWFERQAKKCKGKTRAQEHRGQKRRGLPRGLEGVPRGARRTVRCKYSGSALWKHCRGTLWGLGVLFELDEEHVRGLGGALRALRGGVWGC